MPGMPAKKSGSRVGAGETRLSTVIDGDLYKQVKIAAITHDLSIQAAVSEALEQWLARKGKK